MNIVDHEKFHYQNPNATQSSSGKVRLGKSIPMQSNAFYYTFQYSILTVRHEKINIYPRKRKEKVRRK